MFASTRPGRAEIITDSPVRALLIASDEMSRCVRLALCVSAVLGADCALPVAAHGLLDANGDIHLRALVAEVDGSRIIRAEASSMSCPSGSSGRATTRSGCHVILANAHTSEQVNDALGNL